MEPTERYSPEDHQEDEAQQGCPERDEGEERVKWGRVYLFALVRAEMRD